MTITEWLKTGKRKCDCSDLSLIISIVEIKRPKRRHADNINNLIGNVILGVNYNKPYTRYVARCSQCDKMYLVCANKRELIKDLGEIGIKWQYIHTAN